MQKVSTKEIGQRDSKICRVTDFALSLGCFIGLDIFARLQSLADIARHCDTARIEWTLQLLF